MRDDDCGNAVEERRQKSKGKTERIGMETSCGVGVGEREEPRLKPRPLALSVASLVVPFAKMRNLEEKDWGWRGGGAKYAFGCVECAKEAFMWNCSVGGGKPGSGAGHIDLEVIVYVYESVNKYPLSIYDRLGWGCSGV